MKAIYFLISFILTSHCIYSQEVHESKSSGERQHSIEHRSMITLTAWGGTNLITGSIGWATVTGEAKYFHQMNAGWGLINAGIGIGALLSKKRPAKNNTELLKRSHRTEKILLLNTGLDVAYVTGGFLFRSMSKNNPENAERFRGFGNSLLLQGGFLLLFDITQTILNQRLRKKLTKNDLGSLSLSQRGIGLVYSFN